MLSFNADHNQIKISSLLALYKDFQSTEAAVCRYSTIQVFLKFCKSHGTKNLKPLENFGKFLRTLF